MTTGETAVTGQDVPTTARHDGTTSTVALLTSEEALAWVRSAPRGTRFYIHARMDAPVAGAESAVYTSAIRGSVRMTGEKMLALLRDGLLPELQEKGARWRCTDNAFRRPGKATTHYYWVG
jgi:hypothetical protein